MNELERALRDSRPGPIDSPDHREQLRAMLRESARQDERYEVWSLKQYAAALAAACVLLAAALVFHEPAAQPGRMEMFTAYKGGGGPAPEVVAPVYHVADSSNSAREFNADQLKERLEMNELLREWPML